MEIEDNAPPPRRRSRKRRSIHEWVSQQSTQHGVMNLGEIDMKVSFRPEWEEQYRRSTFDPTIFCISCFLIACFISLTLIIILASDHDGVYGGETWLYLTWLPLLLCGIFQLLIALLFKFCKRRQLMMRLYDIVAAASVIALFSACLATNAMLEFRIARFGLRNSHLITNLTYTSHDLPLRSCTITGTQLLPAHSNVDLMHSCINLVLSGHSFSILILSNVLPMLYGLKMATALAITIVNSSLLTAAAIGVGERHWPLVFCLAVQLAAGLVAAKYCRWQCEAHRRQFAVTMGTTEAAKQNRELLYRLIPRNVVETMKLQPERSGERSGSMLGASMSHCTVMFCSLQPQDELQEGFSEDTFQLLNDTISSFDKAVER